MKKIFLLMALIVMTLVAVAQPAGNSLKPNYCKIGRVVAKASGPFYYDSLVSRFERCDTTLTIDHLRCLYYGGANFTVVAAFKHYTAVSMRFGRTTRQANEAWWQYQQLLSAVWSSGNGSKHKPLHVKSGEDASVVATDFDTPLWFKIRKQKAFVVKPSPIE